MGGPIPDVGIYSRFHRNPFRGFGTLEGRISGFRITLGSGFYNSLDYRPVQAVKSIVLLLLLSENCVILASAVLTKYTRVTDDRQTDRRHIIKIAQLCNVIATFN